MGNHLADLQRGREGYVRLGEPALPLLARALNKGLFQHRPDHGVALRIDALVIAAEEGIVRHLRRADRRHQRTPEFLGRGEMQDDVIVRRRLQAEVLGLRVARIADGINAEIGRLGDRVNAYHGDRFEDRSLDMRPRTTSVRPPDQRRP